MPIKYLTHRLTHSHLVGRSCATQPRPQSCLAHLLRVHIGRPTRLLHPKNPVCGNEPTHSHQQSHKSRTPSMRSPSPRRRLRPPTSSTASGITSDPPCSFRSHLEMLSWYPVAIHHCTRSYVSWRTGLNCLLPARRRASIESTNMGFGKGPKTRARG